MRQQSWSFVVPFKDSRVAKSRLRLADQLRRDVALAMLHDTVHQLLRVPDVVRVVLVCAGPDDIAELSTWPRVQVVIDPGRGLNAAIRCGETAARSGDPETAVAACPADLPVLDPLELAVVLRWCAAHPRCVVADRQGIGTTILTALAGFTLDPLYGPGSLVAHAADGAELVMLPSGSSLRHDVDEMADLELVRRLAPHSRTALTIRPACPR